MDYEEAISLLELPRNYTQEILKKNYYKKCLMYHPDKNKDGEEKFKQIQQAYSLLTTYQPEKLDDNYTSMISSFVRILTEHMNVDNAECLTIEDISQVLMNLIQKKKVIDTLLDQMSYSTLEILNSIIVKHNDIFHIHQNILDNIQTKLKKKTKEKIVIKPSIEDLIENHIYVHTYKEEKYYIPLWHEELEFDEFICSIIKPEHEYISVDSSNDLHIHWTETMESVFSKDTIQIPVGKKHFSIPVEKLYIRKFQIYTLIEQGIPTINTMDIFNVSKKSNVYIYLTLK